MIDGIFRPVKRVCEACGAEVMTPARNLKYCDKCRREQYLRKRREHRQQQEKERGRDGDQDMV